MKKLNLQLVLTLLLSLFITSACFAGRTSTDRMGLVKTTQKDVDKEAFRTIKITYPLIKNIRHKDEINQEINRIIEENVQTFKKNVAENKPKKPISGLPLTVDSNNLEIDYKTFAATRNLISIRFSIYTFFYGAAHPLTVFQSLNFDVQEGKVLSLADVFKSNDYLQFLSAYSKSILEKKLSKAAATSTQPDPEGLKPTPENFQVWNMTDKGLLITFPPYQVAAYAFGPQEVLIPYTAIKDMMRIQYR